MPGWVGSRDKTRDRDTTRVEWIRLAGTAVGANVHPGGLHEASLAMPY